jgi:hypothetical protein
MSVFKQVLEECNFSDMGHKGAKFTWNNGQSDEGYIKERLDRVVRNNEWRGLFSEVTVHILPSRVSNHKPLLITLLRHEEECHIFSKGFKFEASWLLDEEYNDIVRAAWANKEGGFSALSAV